MYFKQLLEVRDSCGPSRVRGNKSEFMLEIIILDKYSVFCYPPGHFCRVSELPWYCTTLTISEWYNQLCM